MVLPPGSFSLHSERLPVVPSQGHKALILIGFHKPYHIFYFCLCMYVFICMYACMCVCILPKLGFNNEIR